MYQVLKIIFIEKFDIIGIVETWIEENDWQKWEDRLSDKFVWKCTYAKREFKKGRAKGGIITGIKRNIEEVENGRNRDNLQERLVKIDNEIWRIVTIYNNNEMDTIIKELAKQENHNEENMIIVGDFNARIGEEGGIINPADGTEIKRRSKDKVSNREGEKLIRFTDDNGWSILNGNTEGDEEGHFTYVGPQGQSVIDYGIVNERARAKIKSLEVETEIESDHLPLRIELEAETDNIVEDSYKTTIYWTEENIKKYKQKTERIILTEEEINKAAEEITTKTFNCLPINNKKRKHYKVKRNTWWCQECREKRRHMKKKLQQLRKGKVKIEQYLNVKKEYKKLCKEKKLAEEEREKEKVKQIKNETQVWKYLQSERGKKVEISKNILMDKWKGYFMQLLGGTDIKTTNDLTNVGETEENTQITREDIQRQIKKLKRKKATGEDGIPNEAWIYGSEEQIGKLTTLINNIWQGKGFPNRWRTGIIHPIYKQGNRDETKNYRGITLLDTAYKIYASILEEKLTEETEAKDILPENQTGFRKNRSTIDNIYVLNYIIQKEISKSGGRLYGFFADLKAAFDVVDREKMIRRLIDLRISENLVKRIAEIYMETRNEVTAHGKNSTGFWTTKGLRQGCPLSPCLFAIYMSDIEKYFSNSQTGGIVIGRKKLWTLAYADDLVIVAKSQREMTSMIKRLESYLETKSMLLNTEKSKIVVFTKARGKERNENWFWRGTELGKTKSIKYLGFTFQKNGQYNEHIKNLGKKANVALSQVWAIGQRRFRNNFQLRMLLFDKLVLSILRYGSEIWGWKTYDEVERIQYKYMRWLLSIRQSTPTYILLEETKRTQLATATGKQAMNYEEKLRHNTWKELVYDCWTEMARREKRNTRNEWEQIRASYYEKKGYSPTEVEIRRNRGQSMRDELVKKHEDIQTQERRENIRKSKSNPRYKKIISLYVPSHLTTDNKNLRIISRFRMGNEERYQDTWRRDEERRCRVCNEGDDTLEHLARDCVQDLRTTKAIQSILHEERPDVSWMKKVVNRRKKYK